MLRHGLKLLQDNFDVGNPSENFCLLRCLDIVSPAMLVQRKRSRLEVAIKTIVFGLMAMQIAGLAYDISQQRDIRATIDMFSMLMLFGSILSRCACLRDYIPHINAMQRFGENPHFRVGQPWADEIRRQSVQENNRFLGLVLVTYFFTVIVYIYQILTLENSFLKIITYAPFDWSETFPILDRSAQVLYAFVGYFWSWHHAACQMTIIVMMRITIAEFHVFLQSLATLDDQIADQLRLRQSRDVNEKRVVQDVLNAHAKRHQELIVVMERMRTILRTYSLVHFAFYMNIVAAFMSRMLFITGSSTLGMALPLLVAQIFFCETFGLCMLVEKLVLMNRQVSHSLYSFDWPRYLPYGRFFRRTMVLMMMQANNTSDFSAGGWASVSANLFAKTCRIVYTLMMCLANVAN